jgi:D-alanine-D-alanine ligase
MAKSSIEKPVIAVLTGGTASELGISLKSAEIVYDNLPKSRYRVYRVLLKNGREWEVYQGDKRAGYVDKNDFSLVIGKEKLSVEAVFVALHGTPAEDGRIQGYLDLMGVPYTTSGVWTSAVSFSKDTTKQVLRQTGVPLANSTMVFSWETTAIRDEKLSALRLPLFVKPNKNGSSYGISKVHNREDLKDAMEKAFEFDDEVMVEEYIKGTEVTCGVLRHKGKLIALPLTEIRTSREFFDYEAKYLGASEEITPAEISEEATLECQELSKKLYVRLDCRGIARFDYILSEGKFYFLEVNTVPGLTSESIVPQQARAYGWSLEELFVNCLEEIMR